MTSSLIICGALGRMGRAITTLALPRDDLRIAAGVVREGSYGEDRFPLYEDLEFALNSDDSSIIVDFSTADSAFENIRLAQKYRRGFLLGTTGYGEDVVRLLQDAAKEIPIVVAPNTSLMATLMMALSRIANHKLASADVGIIDLHHHHKKDAPSGTAKALAYAIGDRAQISSLRMGSIVGEHTVYFVNDFDRLEITHRVSDRRVFAEGALLAAQFLFQRAPGLYDMNDVLDLKMTIEKYF